MITRITDNFIQWYEPGKFECLTRAWNYEKVCGTLAASKEIKIFNGGGTMDNLRIRKLTPRECWRLQGRSDKDFEKAAAVCSDRQLYKQAGNSITVDVLYYLFKSLFEQYPEDKK